MAYKTFKSIVFLLFFFHNPVFARQQKVSNPLQTIPFIFDGHQSLIPVTINNGNDTLHFLFDSGCEVNVLDLHKANTLGLTEKDDAGISGWSRGTLMIPKTGARVLRIGGLSIPYPEFYLQDLKNARMQGIAIDGIIGYQILKTYVVEMDFGQKKMRFYKSGNMRYPKGGELISLGLNYKTPTLQAVIKLPDGTLLPSTYHLITGGDFGILFNQEYVTKYHLDKQLTPTGTITRPDLAGPVTYTECTVPQLQLLHYSMAAIPAMYSPKINDNAPDKEIAGAIGAAVWRNYRLFINLPKKELYLAPVNN